MLLPMAAGQVASFDDVQEALDDAAYTRSQMWMLICGALVMFMQCGFAMLSAGCARNKNAQSVLLKNMIDVCFGMLGWFSVGWSLAYSGVDGGFLGGKGDFFLIDVAILDEEGTTMVPTEGTFVLWFFQWAFCATACTIVSGALMERVNFWAYLVYVIFMTTIIYPIIVAMTWGPGKLSEIMDGAYIDFAGSGIVHLTGGVGAFIGAIILGPRKGRFDPNVDQTIFDPHNMNLVVLGTLILWMCWYGFNCGSTLGMGDGSTADLAGLVACNTTIGAAAGGITAFILSALVPFFQRWEDEVKLDLMHLCNGVLGGLVSITAGCGNVQPYSALIIGSLGGVMYLLGDKLLPVLKIDDPLGAFPVHGCCGMWGMVAAPLFDFGKGFDSYHGWGGWGATAGASTGKGLAANMAVVAFVWVWCGGISGIIFFALKRFGHFRVSEEDEEHGLDAIHHAQFHAHKIADVASVSPRNKPGPNTFNTEDAVDDV